MIIPLAPVAPSRFEQVAVGNRSNRSHRGPDAAFTGCYLHELGGHHDAGRRHQHHQPMTCSASSTAAPSENATRAQIGAITLRPAAT